MRATRVLQMQLRGTNQRFHAILDDLTDEEWTTRVLPETNLIAFDLWHVARTHDTVVQLNIRGVPEVIKQERWAACGALTTPGFELNLTRERADAVARGITRADLAAYADAVHAEISAWLETLDDADLDAIPDDAAHLALEPFYRQDPVLTKEFIEDADGAPVGDRLIGYCIGHCRGHLAEVALFKQQLRLRATSSSPAADASEQQSAPHKRRWWQSRGRQ
jgi:hypothetical protein